MNGQLREKNDLYKSKERIKNFKKLVSVKRGKIKRQNSRKYLNRIQNKKRDEILYNLNILVKEIFINFKNKDLKNLISSLESLKKIIIKYSQDFIDQIIIKLNQKGIFQFFIKSLNTNNTYIIQEITSCLKYIFGKNEKIDNLLINEDIIFIYKNLFNLNCLKIDLNVIDGFSNLVNKNNEIRKIFIKKDILKAIEDLVSKYVKKNNQENFFFYMFVLLNFFIVIFLLFLF